jgi:hypothetical protein
LAGKRTRRGVLFPARRVAIGMLESGYASECLVAAIAEGRVLGVLAVTQPDLLRLGQVELLRPQAAAFVAAIAHGLVPAQTTGAPPVVARRQVNGDGLFIVNFGEIFHGVNLAGDAGSVKRGKAG